MFVIAETLFRDHMSKTEIKSVNNDVQLGPNTMSRRVSIILSLVVPLTSPDFFPMGLRYGQVKTDLRKYRCIKYNMSMMHNGYV